MNLNIDAKGAKKQKIQMNTPGKKKKRGGASLDVKKARAGWIFVLPFIVGFILIYLPIIFDSIKFSFHDIKILIGGGYQETFVGLENYRKALFDDTTFLTTVSNGLKQLILDIPSIVLFSLFVAIILNQKIAGRAAFRAIFFIPVILSTGLISSIDSANILATNMESAGIDDGSGQTSASSAIVSVLDMQNLFKDMMIGTEILEYVVSLVNNIFDIINRCGVQMLIFLSGLQSISPAIYESCSIDGASGWETFWKVTLPMLSPMILVNTVYTIIDSFTSGSNVVMAYIERLYQSSGTNTVTSAMSWMYFLLVMVIIAVVAAILSSFVFYQRRD